MNYRIYSVFHHKLFNELYTGMTDKYKNKLIMFGVNEKYEKIYDITKNYNIQYEYQLTNYRKDLQEKSYCQTSAMYHIYVNNLHSDLDYRDI